MHYRAACASVRAHYSIVTYQTAVSEVNSIDERISFA